MKPHLQLRRAGEHAVLAEVAGNHAARRLALAAPRVLAGLEDVVPGHETVLLRWEAGRRPPHDLRERLEALLAAPAATGALTEVTLEVRYDGPDLQRVADACGIAVDELVRRHREAEYVVGFVGFSPGFAYLLGGDPEIRPPRLDAPRTRVPAGALAVAGEYSAVYPGESPGGWNLIGAATESLVALSGAPDFRLETGMRVRFSERAR